MLFFYLRVQKGGFPGLAAQQVNIALELGNYQQAVDKLSEITENWGSKCTHVSNHNRARLPVYF